MQFCFSFVWRRMTWCGSSPHLLLFFNTSSPVEVLSPRGTFLALTNRQEVPQSVPFLKVQIQDVLQGSTLFPDIMLIDVSWWPVSFTSQKSKYSSQKSVYTVMYHLQILALHSPLCLCCFREKHKSIVISHPHGLPKILHKKALQFLICHAPQGGGKNPLLYRS